MSGGRFCAAINCMDGRTQLPVNQWLRQKYGVAYVDTITEPGPNGILAAGKDGPVVESIRRRLAISVSRHGSRVAAVVGHHDCAGNPTPKETQLAHLRKAVSAVREWGMGIEVVGLWVDENWRVQPVD